MPLQAVSDSAPDDPIDGADMAKNVERVIGTLDHGLAEGLIEAGLASRLRWHLERFLDQLEG